MRLAVMNADFGLDTAANSHIYPRNPTVPTKVSSMVAAVVVDTNWSGSFDRTLYWVKMSHWLEDSSLSDVIAAEGILGSHCYIHQRVLC